MLHVLNGDAAVPAFREADLRGDVVVWQEALCTGPVPGGLATAEAWMERAPWVAEHYAVGAADYMKALADALSTLERSSAEDEVVLWFEEDLFCLLNLLYILTLHPRDAAWSLVCPPEPLSHQGADALSTLFWERDPVTAGGVAAARRVWAAYCQPTPRGLDALLHGGELDPWPVLRDAVALHLSRLPAVGSGLGADEEALLRPLLQGPAGFAALFREAAAAGLRPFGYGDAQAAPLLWRLSRGPAPLVALVGEQVWPLAPGERPLWEVHLTEQGRAVLSGEADRVRACGVTRWLGGVRLDGREPVWRWDAAARRVRLE